MLLASHQSNGVNVPSFAGSQAKRPASPVFTDAQNVLKAMDLVNAVLTGLPQSNRLTMAKALLPRLMDLAMAVPETSISIDHSRADVHLAHGFKPRKKLQQYRNLGLIDRLKAASVGDTIEIECNPHNYQKVRNGCINYVRKALGPKDSGNWEVSYSGDLSAVCIKVLGKPAQTPSQKLSDFLAQVS